MTVQMEDLFLWNHEEWTFLNDRYSDRLFGFYESKKYELFKTEKYGLNVKMFSTNCRKGFVVAFAVKENNLFLEYLSIYCEPGIYPKINGIEAKYNEVLKGENGSISKMLDAKGNIIGDTGESYNEWVKGNDLVLSIDMNIQAITEKYLENACIENVCTDGGNIVVMNPKTRRYFSNGNISKL